MEYTKKSIWVRISKIFSWVLLVSGIALLVLSTIDFESESEKKVNAMHSTVGYSTAVDLIKRIQENSTGDIKFQKIYYTKIDCRYVFCRVTYIESSEQKDAYYQALNGKLSSTVKMLYERNLLAVKSTGEECVNSTFGTEEIAQMLKDIEAGRG